MTTMLYRCPGPHRFDAGGGPAALVSADYLTVDDSDVEAALANGWHLTMPEAAEAHRAQLQADIDAAEAEKKRLAAEIEAQETAAGTLRAVHKGRGVYDVQDGDGNVVATGLTKDEAHARAA